MNAKLVVLTKREFADILGKAMIEDMQHSVKNILKNKEKFTKKDDNDAK